MKLCPNLLDSSSTFIPQFFIFYLVNYHILKYTIWKVINNQTHNTISSDEVENLRCIQKKTTIGVNTNPKKNFTNKIEVYTIKTDKIGLCPFHPNYIALCPLLKLIRKMPLFCNSIFSKLSLKKKKFLEPYSDIFKDL